MGRNRSGALTTFVGPFDQSRPPSQELHITICIFSRVAGIFVWSITLFHALGYPG
jgi:hypothetical protein